MNAGLHAPGVRAEVLARASELRTLDVINITDGRRLGHVFDIALDVDSGRSGLLWSRRRNRHGFRFCVKAPMSRCLGIVSSKSVLTSSSLSCLNTKQAVHGDAEKTSPYASLADFQRRSSRMPAASSLSFIQSPLLLTNQHIIHGFTTTRRGLRRISLRFAQSGPSCRRSSPNGNRQPTSCL